MNIETDHFHFESISFLHRDVDPALLPLSALYPVPEPSRKFLPQIGCRHVVQQHLSGTKAQKTGFSAGVTVWGCGHER
jgi:hypothetical protein